MNADLRRAAPPPSSSPSSPQPPAAGSSLGLSSYVHVRVGRCDVAIPITHVRQALALPVDGLTALPRRSGALLGIADAEGAAVPIVALEHWLPIEADKLANADANAESAQPRLMVLQFGGKLIGIRVDAVLGVKRVAPDAERRVHHTSDEEELFESVIPASGGTAMLCVLEVARLMQLSQAWCVDVDIEPDVPQAPQASAMSGAATASADELSGRAQRHAVFQIGAELWAIPVNTIVHVVPVPEVELSLGRSERCWAISQWQGRKLPLVDISAGRQASGAEQAPWMVLLCQGPLALGLTVSACKQFVDLAADMAAAAPGDALLAGIALVPELGKLHILDADKLFQLTPEAAISRQNTPAEALETSAPSDAFEPIPYIVFDADQRYASPVTGIVGVVELPPQAVDDLLSGQPAALAWRGRSIAVVHLPAIGRQTSTDAPRLAVLVQPADEASPPLGIAIKSLSDWLPAHSAKRSGVRMGTMGELNLLNAPGACDNASLVVVDLAQMAHLLS